MTAGLDAPAARSGFPVWFCPLRQHPNDMLRAVCRDCGAHRPCEHYDAAADRHCGATPVRMYASGPLCDTHKPSSKPTTTITQEAA